MIISWLGKLTNPKYKALKKFLKENNYIIQAENPGRDVEKKIERSYHGINYTGWFSIDNIKTESLSSFVICAPKSDMIETDSSFKTKFNHVPDPVVLYPVDKGYIIVTAWGDEASDQLVINHQNN